MSNLCDNRISMGSQALHRFILEYLIPTSSGKSPIFNMEQFKADSGFTNVGTSELHGFNYNKELLEANVGNPEWHNHESFLSFVSQGQPLALHILSWIAKHYNTRIECVYAEIGMRLSGKIIFNADGSLHSNSPISLYEALVDEMCFDVDYAAEFNIVNSADYLSAVSYAVGRSIITNKFLLTDAPLGMSLEHIQQVSHIAYEASKRDYHDVSIDFFMSVFDSSELSTEISRPVAVLENGVKRITHIESQDIQKTAEIIGFGVFSYPDTIDYIKDIISGDIKANTGGNEASGLQELIDQIEANAEPIMKMVLLSIANSMLEA